MNNSYQTMQMLLEHPNINPIERNLRDMNYTPLHLAAKTNKFYCVKILLDYGVPDKPRSTLDMTPLDLAIEMSNIESIEILKSYSPKIPSIRFNDFFHESSVSREVS
jgi:ankyrin repeat protein